jgi:hypothetical protein
MSARLERAHPSSKIATETQRHGAERVGRRLRRQRVPKNGGNTSERLDVSLAFPTFFAARVSAGVAGRRATRWDLQRALRISVSLCLCGEIFLDPIAV